MKRKKKLLVFNPALAPYRIDQFNKLSEIFDVKVFFLNENVPNQKFDQDFLKKQLKCDFGFLVKGFNVKGRFFRTGIKKEILQFRPDLIMGYEYSLITIYLLWLNKHTKINAQMISMVDDSLDICRMPQSKVRKWLRSWCLKRLDYLVLLSSEVGDWYISQKNILRKKIIVNPIVYNPDRFIQDRPKLLTLAKSYIHKYMLSNRKVLLFVGRIAKEKGLGYLLNIMPALILKDRSIILIIVGEGAETNTLLEIINKKALHEYVLMPGRFEKLELYAWYLTANAFILPSIDEPFGAVVNESLIFGTPVICSQHAGAASLIIEGENGIVVDPKNEKTFTKDVISFVEQKSSLLMTLMQEKQNLMPHDFDYYFLDWYKIA